VVRKGRGAGNGWPCVVSHGALAERARARANDEDDAGERRRRRRGCCCCSAWRSIDQARARDPKGCKRLSCRTHASCVCVRARSREEEEGATPPPLFLLASSHLHHARTIVADDRLHLALGHGCCCWIRRSRCFLRTKGGEEASSKPVCVLAFGGWSRLVWQEEGVSLNCLAPLVVDAAARLSARGCTGRIEFPARAVQGAGSFASGWRKEESESKNLVVFVLSARASCCSWCVARHRGMRVS
jgi:hypothetical protein